jgi:hypothetical protein
VSVRTLTDADVVAIVDALEARLAPRLGSPDAPDWVDAAELARRLGVGIDYVYDHAADLGAIRLGDGPRARLRFDAREAAGRLAPRDDSMGSATTAKPVAEPKSPRRRRRVTGAHRELLPIRTPK